MKPIHSYIWEFKQPARDGDSNEDAKKINKYNSAHAAHILVDFFAVTARLRRGIIECESAPQHFFLYFLDSSALSKYSTQEIIRLHLANWANGNYHCFSKHRCSDPEELSFALVNIQLDDCKCVRRQFNL